MSDRIMTLHPDKDKQGTNIDREKYDVVRASILDGLRDNESLTFRGLQAVVEKALDGSFDGSIGWYYTTVKLDLEARGEIERVPGSSPQELRLVK